MTNKQNKPETFTGRPSSWLLVALFLLITLFQYAEHLNLPDFLANVNENLGLTRFSLERILYLLPIIWAGMLYGRRGGAIAATIAVACMLPRSIFISDYPEDAIVESIAIFIVGNTVAISLESLKKERERRAELEIAQAELQSQLHVIEEDEKRLAALNQTSIIISQSLELPDVLDSAVSCVIKVMEVEIVRIYILNEATMELELAAHRGVSEEFVKDVGSIKIGEGFNGKVLQTGKPLFVEDSLEDPRLTKLAAQAENIRSQIIVPMMAKGKVVGTIAVAMHSYRKFLPEEAELLTAIGNQVGVAVDNAHLYLHERQTAEQLNFLVQQITRAQEEERKRISQELHDDTVQAMVVHAREIEGISGRIEKLSKKKIHACMDDLYQQANVIMQGVQRLSQDLRPAALDRLGLLPAVEWIAARTAEYSGIDIDVQFLGKERRLPDEVELVLFRITQEALRNVWKHAGATSAEATVEFMEKSIRITIKDNGKGFDPPHSMADLPRWGMLGLAGMQERARILGGTLTVASKTGEGTTVTAELPV